jgi:DNA-binding transcriptional ArsR family regulator
MNTDQAAETLEALGNPTRLAIFRLLVQAGEAGAPVGVVQKALDIPASTLSHHISRLTRANLVTQERRSRELICRANYETMREMMSFLTDNCCGGLDLGRDVSVA